MDGTEPGMWAGQRPHGVDYLTDDGFRCGRCRHVRVSFSAGPPIVRIMSQCTGPFLVRSISALSRKSRGAFIVLTVFFQQGLGYSALRTGLFFLPFAVGFSVASAVSGPIAARIGARILYLGTVLMTLGLSGTVALARFAPTAVAFDGPLLGSIFLVYGLGQGLAQPALINTVIGSSGVTGEDAGSAAGLFLTVAQSSIALGVAALGDVFFTRLGEHPTSAAYFDALASTLSCNLVLQAATFLLVFLLRRVSRLAPATR